jgi:hypothetical protein
VRPGTPTGRFPIVGPRKHHEACVAVSLEHPVARGTLPKAPSRAASRGMSLQEPAR